MTTPEPPRPRHNLFLPHNFRTAKDDKGKWYDVIECVNSTCPAAPATVIPVKDLRPDKGEK